MFRSPLLVYALMLVSLLLSLWSVSQVWAQGQLSVIVDVSDDGERMMVYGLVTDLYQQPVKGAQVSIQVDDAAGKTIHLALVYTDENGRFSDEFRTPEDVNREFKVYVSAVKVGFERAFAEREYTAIPEFSAVTLVAALVILASLMLRKAPNIIKPAEFI